MVNGIREDGNYRRRIGLSDEDLAITCCPCDSFNFNFNMFFAVYTIYISDFTHCLGHL